MFQGTGALAFNAAFYLQSNPDVFQAIQNGTFQGSALDHFVQFGQFEGRDPNAFFDTEYYLENNTDVLVAIADPANPSVVSAFQHFVEFGSEEGVVRAPSAAFASFNAETYLAQNPDLQAAFGNLTGEALEDRLFQHFVEFGVNENRPGSGVDAVANPGSNFVLTGGVDNLVGTSGDDVFTGVDNGPVALLGSTLQTGDTIDGGGGFDTLRVVANRSLVDAQLVTPNLTNIERVEYSIQNANVGLNLAQSTGVQEIAVVGGAGVTTGELNVIGVQAPVTVELSNTSGSIDLDYATNVKSPTAGQDVLLNNVDSGTVNVSNASTFNLTVTGENDLANLVGGQTAATKLTTVNVDGAGSLVVAAALAASVTTLNASANTGGVEADLSATGTITATGGSGDDVFVFGGSLTKTDVVNGGAGFDTVSVVGDDYTSTAAAAPFNALKSIERVEFTGATGATLQGSTFTNAEITNLLFNTDGNDTILNAGAARTYEFGTENGGSAAFAMKAGQSTLNVDLLGDDDGLDADVAGITVTTAGTGSTTTPVTINLDSQGDLVQPATAAFDADNYNQTGLITAASGSTVNIDGSANLAVFGGDVDGSEVSAGFANNVIVDASDFGGQLVIAGSSFADGSVGTVAVTGQDDEEDNVTGVNTVQTQGIDTITLSTTDARDVIVFENGLASGIIEIGTPAGGTAATGAAVTGNVLVDTIINFEAGEGGDVLFVGTDLDNAVPATAGDYTAIAADTQNDINELSGADATLLRAANIALGDTGVADGQWTAFSFGADTYAVRDAQTGTDTGAGVFDNADLLVRLTGVNVADLTDANFAA